MSLELFDLSGKTALVTGGSRGIGFEIAKGIGKAGARVVINARNPQQLDAAVESLRELGIEAFGYVFDVTDETQVKDSIGAIEGQVGRIDILFNNAGINLRGALEDYDLEDWQKVIDTNLAGVFLVSKYVVKNMIENKSGKIINTCSMMSELGRNSTGAYAASKGGVKMLTKAMTVEWAKYNIQINGIGPGYFSSEMTRPLVEDEKFNNWICSRTPANRWGQLTELVGAAIFLASEASSFVNGQVIYVDGGILAAI